MKFARSIVVCLLLSMMVCIPGTVAAKNYEITVINDTDIMQGGEINSSRGSAIVSFQVSPTENTKWSNLLDGRIECGKSVKIVVKDDNDIKWWLVKATDARGRNYVAGPATSELITECDLSQISVVRIWEYGIDCE